MVIQGFTLRKKIKSSCSNARGNHLVRTINHSADELTALKGLEKQYFNREDRSQVPTQQGGGAAACSGGRRRGRARGVEAGGGEDEGGGRQWRRRSVTWARAAGLWAATSTAAVLGELERFGEQGNGRREGGRAKEGGS